jgi:hypothetical protein
MFSSFILKAYRKSPAPVRRKMSGFRRKYKKLASKVRLKTIAVDACLFGGYNGVSAAGYARLYEDIRRPSLRIWEWEHVKLLRQYDEIGDRIWEPAIFERTDYYRCAVLCMSVCGRYFDAVVPSQIQYGAKRFVNWYRGVGESLPLQIGQSDEENLNEYITVHPVMDSSCYEVVDGHHRLSIAYMRGVREVRGFIKPPCVATPVQELLLDVQDRRLQAQRELYQPVDSPEVAGWITVRRCSDRLAKMVEFLRLEGLMPPASGSYLDVASSYGWFVSEMSKAGFRAEGVERDPSAIAVGQVMYGLKREQLHRSDAVSFLQALGDKYDVTSCFSLAHWFILNRQSVSAEELLHLLDSATRSVMFFEMGQSHEEFFSGKSFTGWDPDHIQHWLKANTTFTRILPLGVDEDAVPPFQNSYGRMLFACLR